MKPQQTSLDRGLRLLALIQERGELRLAQLIEELGSSRATVFRALSTLQAHGFVEHDRASRAYRLGPALRSGQSPAIVQQTTPALQELVEQTGETAGLLIVHGRRMRFAALVEGTYGVRFQASVGDEVAANANAGGKAILASLTSAQRDGFLGSEPYPGYTQRTIVRRAPLEWDLESVRERGYAVDDQETELGTRGVAAAILGPGNRPLGAIVVAAPSTRLSPAEAPSLGRTIAHHCARVGTQLPQ